MKKSEIEFGRLYYVKRCGMYVIARVEGDKFEYTGSKPVRRMGTTTVQTTGLKCVEIDRITGAEKDVFGVKPASVDEPVDMAWLENLRANAKAAERVKELATQLGLNVGVSRDMVGNFTGSINISAVDLLALMERS